MGGASRGDRRERRARRRSEQRIAALDTACSDEAEAALAPDKAAAPSRPSSAPLTILLREGLEALLIVVAMLAFLNKADRRELTRPVHYGWISALVAGVATWWAATSLITVSGASRELTEGFGSCSRPRSCCSSASGCTARRRPDEWQRYIRDKLRRCGDQRLGWFLFSLAFIAVYREVFETILFFAALAAEGNVGALIAGALVGAMRRSAVIAVAMLRFSRRLPIGKFFAYSSALVAVLAVVLAGKGVAALQEAGLIGVHSARRSAHPGARPVPDLAGIAGAAGDTDRAAGGLRVEPTPLGGQARRRLNRTGRDKRSVYSCSQEEESDDGGREQGDPGRQSGRGSGGAFAQQRRRSREHASRHVGELEGPRRQAPGADRVAQCRDLQREPRQGRQELSEEGLARSISKARSRPANGPTSRATTATRPRSCFRNSAASCSCSTAARAAAAQSRRLQRGFRRR